MLLIRHSKPCGKAKITDFLQMDKVQVVQVCTFLSMYTQPLTSLLPIHALYTAQNGEKLMSIIRV